MVVVGSALGPTEQAQEQVRQGLVAGGIALVLLGGVGSWLLAGAALRPVERLRREVDEISEQDPPPRWTCHARGTSWPRWRPP